MAVVYDDSAFNMQEMKWKPKTIYILSGKWVYHIYYYVSTLVLKTSHFLRTQLYSYDRIQLGL